MTIYAYRTLLDSLNRKIAWDVQVAALPGSGKLDDTLHPFFPETPIEKQSNRNPEGLGSLIDKINKHIPS